MAEAIQLVATPWFGLDDGLRRIRDGPLPSGAVGQGTSSSKVKSRMMDASAATRRSSSPLLDRFPEYSPAMRLSEAWPYRVWKEVRFLTIRTPPPDST